MKRAGVQMLMVGILAVGLCFSGCGRGELRGPPEVKLGRVECHGCGMLVSEDRCSTATLVEERGLREYQHYDDLGCMLDDEVAHGAGLVVVERYVRDYGTRGWVRAEAASYLMSDPKHVQTPMGSGMVAFARREDAERAQKEHGGTVLTYEGLGEARKTWREQHFGPRGG